MFAWRYRIHAICVLSVLAILFVPWYMNKPDKNTVDATNNAALEFLQMVDEGRYDDSWQIVAPYLQKKIPLPDWKSKLAKDRKTIGELDTRSLEDASKTAATEELPDSELILLKYSSQFKLKEVEEVVTVIQGKDNRWRVVGYFIQ